MLASKTKSVWRYDSGNTGLKCSKTLSAIERVSRVFRSHEYSPDQRNVLPFTRWTPSLSILRNFQNSNSDSGKSSPTTPTSRTGETQLAPSPDEQAGYNRDTARAGGDHLLEIIDLDSTNAEDREIYIEMRLLDVFESDRLIIGFGRRCENRTEADIISALALCCARLAKAVR